MHPRLDPGCDEATTLAQMHRDQSRLLVGDPESQLASVIRMTQENQVSQHLRACPRCHEYGSYRGCPDCGFDTRRSRHGWMCPQQPSRWTDIFPWNWRSKHAPPVTAASYSAPPNGGSARRVPVREAAREPMAAAPTARSGPSGPPPPPKPRPRPSSPKPDALQLAYQVLGVSPSASDEDVRAAYRAKAQQYHPDKVATLAPEFRDVAEKKMKEINDAYERVKRAR